MVTSVTARCPFYFNLDSLEQGAAIEQTGEGVQRGQLFQLLATLLQLLVYALYFLVFLPQLDVLEKASWFITHAGTGSVMESIWFGVPMIGIPQMPEQMMTARRLEELDLGKAFPDKNQVTSQSLREAIEEVIGNNSYRDQVAEFQKDMKSSGGYVLTADTILEFLKSKRQI